PPLRKQGSQSKTSKIAKPGEAQMSFLTLAQASIIVDKALEKGRDLNLQPLTVVVLDAGGQLKAMKREDRSSLLRPEIATGKAWGTLGMGFGGREFARRGRRQSRRLGRQGELGVAPRQRDVAAGQTVILEHRRALDEPIRIGVDLRRHRRRRRAVDLPGRGDGAVIANAAEFFGGRTRS